MSNQEEKKSCTCGCGHDHHHGEAHDHEERSCCCGHDHHDHHDHHEEAHEDHHGSHDDEVLEKFTLQIQGLDCANCARELEEEILKLPGVEECMVHHVMQKVFVQCPASVLDKVKYTCNHFEDVKVVEAEAPVAPAISGGKRIKVANLCCANCARELEEELNALDGVEAVVDFMHMQITVKASDTERFEEAVYHISHFEDVKIVDGVAQKP